MNNTDCKTVIFDRCRYPLELIKTERFSGGLSVSQYRITDSGVIVTFIQLKRQHEYDTDIINDLPANLYDQLITTINNSHSTTEYITVVASDG